MKQDHLRCFTNTGVSRANRQSKPEGTKLVRKSPVQADENTLDGKQDCIHVMKYELSRVLSYFRSTRDCACE
jgi:hypothetical protein